MANNVLSLVSVGSGANTLMLYMSEDAYQGNAQFTVSVDGVQIGGVQTATASHASGTDQEFDVHGTFSPGPHTVTVNFLNDLYGGSPSADRNLYVDSAAIDGVSIAGGNLTLLRGGPQQFAFSVPTPTPTPMAHVQLLGVNLSGGEYGPSGTGQLNTDYTYPTHGEIDYYASEGLNVLRIPFQWERVQPVQGGPLNQSELSHLDDLVSYAASKGMKVDLDPHGYGYGYGNLIGSSGTSNASFADFWGKMAAHYAPSPNVIFGLMNQPHDQTAAQWATSAQSAVNAIRSVGATQEILTPGTSYDGASTWVESGNSVNVGTITDPDHNMVFEVHQYFDSNGSGTSTNVVSPTVGPDRLAEVTQWAQNTGNKLFLGEFGTGSDPASLTALGNTLNFLNAHSDVWQGGTYWTGGPWLGNYMFSAEPQNGVTAPQTALLAAAIKGSVSV